MYQGAFFVPEFSLLSSALREFGCQLKRECKSGQCISAEENAKKNLLGPLYKQLLPSSPLLLYANMQNFLLYYLNTFKVLT